MPFSRPARALFALITAGGVVVGTGLTAASANPVTPHSTAKQKPAVAQGARNLKPWAAPKEKNTVLIVTRSKSTSLSHMSAMLSGERTPLGLTVRKSLPLIDAVSVSVPAARANAVAASLRTQPGVSHVEVSVPREYLDVTPNDPYYAGSQARYLGAYNPSTGVGGVNAPAAWGTTTGSSSVKIAILDSGVDTSVLDLPVGTKVVGDYYADISSTNPADMVDTVGHGTFVAGVAAATTNNATSVAGAGWDSSILAVKIDDANGVINADDEILGIQWAVTNGASVINLSIGSTTKSAAEQDAIDNAIGAGVIVVAAAGNKGDLGDPVEYPADYPGVISVGATDAAGHRAAFSEFGSSVTVGAPGTNIYSTTVPGGSEFFPAGTVSHGDGTSFASPIVAGEAALLKAAEPAASADNIKAAIINSAHGYSGQGLGHGQVDFAGALTHLAPDTIPVITAPAASESTGGIVTLTATTSAPAVQFSVDGTKVGGLITASAGSASFDWSSWGQSDGTHSVTAVDCSSHGECGASTPNRDFSTTNAAPLVTGPIAGPVTGLINLTATAGGGGVGFFIDGHQVGYDPSSPYAAVSTTTGLVNGSHTVTAVSCASATVCNGTPSAGITITTTGLPLTFGGFSSPFSPNGDGVKDTTTGTLTIPGATQSAQLRVLNASGVTVYNRTAIGSMPKGSHSITWNGKSNNGSTISDGYDTVIVDTTSAGTTDRGAGIALVHVDNTAPTLTGVVGAGTTFYPVADGYRDAFSPSVTQNEASTLTLYIKTLGGSIVRTVALARPVGVASVTWNGLTSAGKLAAAGTYHFLFKAQDNAGNVRYTTAAFVVVSLKKLVSHTATVVKYGNNASHYVAFGPNLDGCVFYDDHLDTQQVYSHGVDFWDQCNSGIEGPQASAGLYTFNVPAATIYNSLSATVTGRTFFNSGTIYFGYDIVNTAGLTDGSQTYPYKNGSQVTSASTHTYYLGSVNPAFHVADISGVHKVFTEFDLTNNRPFDLNDFDVSYITMTVKYQVLT